jgi:HK97 family phage prohead protease
MPIPKPNKGEIKKDFLERCMIDLTKEYSNEQAYAICEKQWDDTNKKTHSNELQIKTVKVSNIKADEGKNIITGYASFFNNKDSHNDVIVKGSFTKTIKENKDRIKVLWQHDMKEPIGKPISMIEDEKGLYTESKISMTETGKKAIILARDGVLTEMSIGFYPIKENYDSKKNINIISEIKLLEYSLVTIASNPLANVTSVKDIRSLINEYEYSKGNVLDIIAEQLFQKIIALKDNSEPLINTHVVDKSQSIDEKEIDLLIQEMKKIRRGVR